MVPKTKPNNLQAHLPLPKGDLWEKLPEPKRIRVCQLLGQMLQAVAKVQWQKGREDERED